MQILTSTLEPASPAFFHIFFTKNPCQPSLPPTRTTRLSGSCSPPPPRFFALDQAHRFRQLDATVFADRITPKAGALALSGALAGTSSALDQQLAATAGTDDALDAVRRAISAEYAVLKTRKGAGSPEVLKIFGSNIEDYTKGLTHTNAAEP